MAFKYLGDATLGVSLSVETPKPLDSRTVVNNIDELYSIPSRYAYEGMTVSNIDNGNIYMLVDKNLINLKEGWKASYESILIIPCTEEEYKLLAENTDDNYNPIDESLPYLHRETYYYLYEDSMEDSSFYLHADWGKNIEELLKTKASISQVVNSVDNIKGLINSLSNGIYTTLEKYLTKESASETYVPKTELENYYTKETVDNTFLKISDVLGDNESDNFIFVTKTKYDEDLAEILAELDKTLKTDGEGSLDTITVDHIKSGDFVVDVKPEGLFVGEDKFAVQSEIPNLITISQEEYSRLEENGELLPDTYYYVYDSEETYVTTSYLASTYLTKSQIQSQYYTAAKVNELFEEKINPLNDIYLKIEDASNTYVTKEDNSATLENYVTKTDNETILSDYVTKESLRGPGIEGDDFIFVTLGVYNTDKQLITDEILHCVKTDSDAQLNSLKTNCVELKESEDIKVTLTTSNEALYVSGKRIANDEDVPRITYISQQEYDQLIENNEIDEDVLYCTYGQTPDVNTTGYVRSEDLEGSIQKVLNAKLAELMELNKSLETRILALETKILELTQTP